MRPALVAAAILLAAPPLAARAQLVTYTFSAEVVSVNDPYEVIGDAIQIDDVLTGEIQYSLSLVDQADGADVGSYFAEPPGDNYINGTNGASGHFETLDLFGAYVEDNAPWGADYLQFYASGDTTPTALDNPVVDYIDLDIELIDNDQSALSGDALPGSLDLADFEEANLFLTGEWFNPEIFNYEFSFSVDAILTSLTPASPPGSSGDFNSDGSVDAADYTVWRDGLGGAYTPSDYDDWVANYGAVSPTGSAAPEPGALGLFAASLAACFGLAPRRVLSQPRNAAPAEP